MTPVRRGRYAKTLPRREAVMRLLRDGKAIRGESLRQAAMPDLSIQSLHLLIRCMRADGYRIETVGRGPNNVGYRLIAQPARAA